MNLPVRTDAGHDDLMPPPYEIITSRLTPRSTPWGAGIAAERLQLIEEFEATVNRALIARQAGSRAAASQAERDQMAVIDACAIHRAAIVNDILAALRMASEDAPGIVEQFIAPIIEHVMDGYEQRIQQLEGQLRRQQRDVDRLEDVVVNFVAPTN